MGLIPYQEALGGRDARKVIAETPQRWHALLDAVTAEQAEVSMAPGKWSLRELMAHLADCEIVWGWRMRQAFGEDHARITPFDQDAWARAYPAYTFEAAKATFFALRAWNVLFVRALSEADWSRTVIHPERGEETLGTIVEIMAGHDLHHLKLLEARP